MTLCEKKSGGRILCIRLSGLGDIVHALNAVSLLRKHRPEAYIAWVVEDRFSSLLRGHPYIDELIVVPRKGWASDLKNPFRWGSVLRDIVRFARMLRDMAFQVSVDFQSSIKSAWLVAAAGADTRVGFGWSVARELSPLVNNRLVSAPTQNCHRIERDIALLGPLGIPASYEDPVLVCSDRDSRRIDDALPQRRGKGPLVMIHPGTSDFAAFKRWNSESYAEVADRLVAEKNADVMVSWGPGEEPVARRVLEKMKQEASMAPRTENLEQLDHLLSYAELFIGSDTGPMHLASALKVPTVALFGPKDPIQTGPYCSRSEVVTGRAECRPCRRRTCRDPLCMRTITAEDVFAAACRVLAGGGECRAESAPPKRGFTFGFELGEWTGRVDCSYSTPEFFLWLCTPQAITEAPDTRVISRSRGRTVLLASKIVSGRRRELVLKMYRPPEKLSRAIVDMVVPLKGRNSWRQAIRLATQRIPVPFHVGYMRKGPPWRREELLVMEKVPHGAKLADWLASQGKEGWRGLSPRARADLVRAVASMIRDFHRKNFYHGDLRESNLHLLEWTEPEEPRLAIIDIADSRWIGWMPDLLKDVLRGADLRRLLQSLETCLTEDDKSRFFTAYYEDFIESPRRQRFIEWVSENFPKGPRKNSLRRKAKRL